MRRLILRPPRPASLARGVTLIELMIGLAITAVLMIAGAPFFGDYIANARLREGGNALLSEALFAQSEAIKRNGTVRLTVSGSRMQLFDRSETDLNALVRERTLPQGVSVDATLSLDFGSAGRPVPFGTEYTVNLGASGVSCSDAYRCPALRVEAGGAVRLCAQKELCS